MSPIPEEQSSQKKLTRKTVALQFEDETQGAAQEIDYDDFDYVQVLKWEMEREKENMIGISKDADETEAEKFIKTQEARERAVKEAVYTMVEDR